MSNVKFQHLESHDLYPLNKGNGYLVYAPLADACFEASEKDVAHLEKAVEDGSIFSNPEFESVKDLISDTESFSFREHTPRSLTGLSILPTWNCNFSCSYCYAANAHKRKNIDSNMAKRALDYFFANMGDGEIALQILGGGEPFTEWTLVKEIATFARECENRYGRPLTLSIATNGSILNQDIITDLISLNIRLSYSFDILEDIQNKQRSSYSLVSHNLSELIEAGLGQSIFIRTVITKYNVARLHEIAGEVIQKYPEVSGVIAEPVMGSGNFTSIDDYAEFCEMFYQNFSEAREYSLSRNLNFTTMALRNVDFSINYGCEGDFCITPDGEISICHRLASPKNSDTRKDDIYGYIDGNDVIIDAARYSHLIGTDITRRPECKNCFAKYNCGGGCIARNLTEPARNKSIYCDLFRRLIKDELLRRYKKVIS